MIETCQICLNSKVQNDTITKNYSHLAAEREPYTKVHFVKGQGIFSLQTLATGRKENFEKMKIVEGW